MESAAFAGLHEIQRNYSAGKTGTDEGPSILQSSNSHMGGKLRRWWRRKGAHHHSGVQLT